MAAYLRRVAMFGIINFILLVFVRFTSGAAFPNPPANQGNPLANDPALKMHVPPVQDQQRMAQQQQQDFVRTIGKNFGQGLPNLPKVPLPNRERAPAANLLNKMKPGMNKGSTSIKIAESEECMEDVVRLCSAKTVKTHNFAILDCLQSDLGLERSVSEKCQHYIWSYKHNLTTDDRFEAASKEVCKQALTEIPECQLQEGMGQRIPCLIEYMDNITDNGCQQFLNKMAKIVFSDFRLVWHFMQNCKSDVEKLNCGRMDTADDIKLHSQGKTILCLAKNIGELDSQCKKQVLRVAELQSDDYHLDRPLFYACRESRELFCADTHAGDGKVFECLFKHKASRGMDEECSHLLTIRQQMMAEDVRVEKTFFSACRKSMMENRCLVDKDGHEDTSRSRVLLCLESALKQDKKVSAGCIGQMTLLRRQLMSDYQATPEIITKCDHEIKVFCNGGIQKGGQTIHCLLKFANIRNDAKEQFGAECKAVLTDLLREADVGEDVSVDRVLQEACAPVLNNECKGVPGNKVVNCLMDKVDSDDMTDECEDHLLEIQYFVVRDFKLDPELYKNCHKDAMSMCHAPANWFDDSKPTAEVTGMVFSCLYRHMKESELSDGCKQQVKRTMRRRAKRIDLEPAIEDSCLQDLGAFCSDLDHYSKGMEISCLQDNLDSLDEKCQRAISDFTEDEDEDLDLDTILMKACTPMIKKFCSDLLDHNAEAFEVMNCLIEEKNNRGMDEKCAAGVEHHQLIQLKDIRFNHAFKDACFSDVKEHCGEMRNKTGIIVCLSELVRKNTLMEESQKVSKRCRQQLRVEVLQRGETIKLDPKLQEACQDDVSKFKCNSKTGDASVTECLRNHQQALSKSCHILLFKREQDETVQGADFLLFKECKSMIKTYCRVSEAHDVLDCLKKNKNQIGFEPNCRAVVLKRTLQETKDYRLNPSLAKSCRLDIPKFCKDVTNKETQDNELEGKIINCLKMQFIKKRLSRECHMEIKLLVKEVQQDINMDPVLMHACESQIRNYCSKEASDHEPGDNLLFRPSDTGDKVVECLEQKLMEGKIEQTSQCAREVLRIVEEAHVDVNIDPVLYTACLDDLARWCRDYESGEGKKMSCLLGVLEDYPDKMKPKCNKLLAQRKTLWEFAAKSAPAESLSDLSQQVMQSPAKSYLLGVLLTLVGIIFIVGITCGRVTKRVTAEMKNR